MSKSHHLMLESIWTFVPIWKKFPQSIPDSNLDL